jgi:hypothetical protein
MEEMAKIVFSNKRGEEMKEKSKRWRNKEIVSL